MPRDCAGPGVPIIGRMQDSPTRDTRIALALALTVRHDGHGGIADGLTDPAGLMRKTFVDRP